MAVHSASSRIKAVGTARARVTRADGRREVYYSVERVPFWQVRRRLKLHRHVRFLRNEDRREGWA